MGRGFTSEEGFSLLELLIAVAILAVAAMALLESQTGAVRMTSRVQQQALAAMVAENRMAALRGKASLPVPGHRSGTEKQLSAEFEWRETVSRDPSGRLLMLDVAVLQDKEQLAHLTGYRRAR